MNNVYSTVFERGEPVFDIAGKFLHNPLNETKRIEVKAVMMSRLVGYAIQQMETFGFPVSCHEVCVQLTIDPGETLGDGVFSVGFKNEKGGIVGVYGIMIKNAWPFIDHGFFIDTD